VDGWLEASCLSQINPMQSRYVYKKTAMDKP